MKKVILPVLLCISCLQAVKGQVGKIDDIKKSLETTNKDTIAWTHGGVLDLGANEGFLHNWAAGGELASMSISGIFSGYLNKLHNRDIWSNNLDLAYGLTYAYSTSFIPHKTDDRIDFTSKYGVQIDSGKNFFFTGLFNFKSQFTRGYNYSLPHFDSISTSKFMSPAYFTLAAGAEYRKGSDLSLFLSPIAGRLTLVDKYYTLMSPQGAFGVPYGKNAYYQFGAYFSGRYVININKNMVFKTRLDLYSNYLAKDTKDSTGAVIKKDNPGNISVLFDNLFSYKLSKYFNVTIGATFIYDNNVPFISTPINKDQPGNGLGWVQLNQTFNFGIEYKFN